MNPPQLLDELTKALQKNAEEEECLRNATSLREYSLRLASSKDYRILLGKNPSIWNAAAQSWQAVLSFTEESDTVPPYLLESIRAISVFCRNLVADVHENQDLFSQSRSSLRHIILRCSNRLEDEDKSYINISRFTLETLSNALSGNDALLTSFWKSSEATNTEELLCPFARSENESCSLPTLLIIQNYILISPSNLQQLLSDANGVHFFRKALKWASNSDTEHITFKIGYTIITKVITSHSFSPCFTSIELDESYVSPEQINLLRFLDAYIASDEFDSHITVDTIQDIVSFLTYKIPQYSKPLLSLPYAEKDYQSFIRSQGPYANSNEDDYDDYDLKATTAKLLSFVEAMTTLATITTELDSKLYKLDDNANRSLLAPKEVVSSLISWVDFSWLVYLLEQVVIFRFRKSELLSVYRTIPSFPTSPGAFSSALTTLIGTLAYEQSSVQNMICDEGGLQLLVSIAAAPIDDMVAPSHERSFFAITNIIKDNPENQRIIKELQEKARTNEN